ncbi:MAG: right-handed parallel beta-helix repeat-containing protein [Thermoguttaceae bacterium]
MIDRKTTAMALFLLLVSLGLSAAEGPPMQPWFPKAPPLAKPTGEVIRATTVAELFKAAKDVKPGGTILLADGHYPLPQYLDLHTDNITLRSESGQRDKVVIDDSGKLGELIWIARCSGVTIADLTIQNVKWNGFKLNSNWGVNKVTIYNCVIHNIWQRGIKGVMVPEKDRERLRPYDCRVQYCLFYNDRPKQFSDDISDQFGGDYVGGMDIMYAKRWTISDNVFVGIHGKNRLARGAIFLWVNTEDCTIERNIIVDCDCGICLGNSHRGEGTKIHDTGCIVRNNFVTRCPENAILADYTRDCKILHNTVHDPKSRTQRLIRLVHDNDGQVVANNLLSGSSMRLETTSPMRIEDNVIQDLTQWLVHPAAGNLHLKPGAVEVLGTVKQLTAILETTEQRRHLWEYVAGLFSDVKRKNAETIAYFHDQDRQALQKFIGQSLSRLHRTQQYPSDEAERDRLCIPLEIT